MTEIKTWRHGRNGRQPAGPGWLRLESLEDRLVPDAAAPVVDLSGLRIDPNSYDPSHVLVQLQPGVTPASLQLPGLAGGEALPLVADVYKVNLTEGWTVPQALGVLAESPLVLHSQPDYLVSFLQTPDDTYFASRQWDLNNTGQGGGTVGADIRAPAAWDVTTGTGRITVGVIDSGIDYNHPDLYLNVWINQGEIPSQWLAGPGLTTVVRKTDVSDVDGDGKITFRDLNAPANAGKVNDVNGDGRIDAGDLLAPLPQGGWCDGTDADGNGFKDDLVGWNFVANTNDPMDDNSHGTHVAGTIGAVGDNGIGIAGIAWNVRLIGLKFLGSSGSGSTSNAIKALNYAVAMGAQISNNSWGGGGYNSTLYAAIQNARSQGHIFVAAAGNNGSNNDVTPSYPDSYDLDNIVSVAATDRFDRLDTYSNYGVVSVDLGAPGTSIYSTAPGGGYALKSGTSMAAPHVAGALALLWDRHPDWTYSQVISRLFQTVDPLPSLQGKVATGGRLNLAAALGSNDEAPPPAPPPPSPAITADRFEVNDTPAAATNLGKTTSISQTGLTLHTAADDDYYRFTVPKGATFTISVTPTQGSGTLSLALLNSQLAPLASGQSSTGAVRLTLSLQSGLTYYLKASSPTGSLIAYDLSMSKQGGRAASQSLAPEGAERTAAEPGAPPVAAPPLSRPTPIFLPAPASEHKAEPAASPSRPKEPSPPTAPRLPEQVQGRAPEVIANVPVFQRQVGRLSGTPPVTPAGYALALLLA